MCAVYICNATVHFWAWFAIPFLYIFCRSFCFFVVVIADALWRYIYTTGWQNKTLSLVVDSAQQAGSSNRCYCCSDLCCGLGWKFMCNIAMGREHAGSRSRTTRDVHFRRILIILSCGLKLSARSVVVIRRGFIDTNRNMTTDRRSIKYNNLLYLFCIMPVVGRYIQVSL